MKIFEEKLWLIYVLMPLGVGTVFGLAGASSQPDTFEALGPSWIKATGYAIVIWVVMYPIMTLVSGAFYKRPTSIVLRQILSCMLGALPLSFIFAWLHNAFGFGAESAELRWMSLAEYDDLVVQRYFKVLIAVTPLWTILTYKWYKQQETVNNLIFDDDLTAEEPIENTNQTVRKPPAFLAKMTKPIGRTPWAIKAEQHYIRIYTQEGDELVLYRFSDAVKSLEDFEGMQVHRSYWVSFEAIDSRKIEGTTLYLTLRNGIDVPVSKSYRKQVEALMK